MSCVPDASGKRTVEALVRRLQEGGVARPALRRVARPAEVPLSFAQRRLWFLHRLEGPSATYNIPLAVRLVGRLDGAALEAALGDVVGRHESLRTVFPEVDGRATQRVLGVEEAGVRLEVVESGEAGLDEALREVARRGFELEREAPVRARLLVVGSQEHVLALVVHHIASDGWSMGPLGRDLSLAYAARSGGREPAWAELPVQYVDYTLWQRELLGSESDPESVISRQLEYWKKALEGMPEELLLPTDRQRPAVMSYRGGTVALELDAELHRGLLALGGAQLILRPLLHESPKIVAEYGRRLIERGPDHRTCIHREERCDHAYRLGALPRKNEANFGASRWPFRCCTILCP